MKFLIRLCCRMGFVVFQNGQYRFLGGRKLTNQESFYVEHKWVKFEAKKVSRGNNQSA